MFTKKSTRASIVFLFMVLTLSFGSQGQVRVPFTQRISPVQPYANQPVYHIRGDFTIIGNKNLTSIDQFQDNNSGYMVYVNVDDNPETVNSSSATLQFSNENNAIPECSNIVFAGLYWTGRTHDESSPNTFQVTNPNTNTDITLDKGRVKLKHQDAPDYITINASHGNYSQNIYFPVNTDGYMYSAFADVTTYVQQYGIGEYTVADIALRDGVGGAVGFYGGWGMVVVYENSRMKWRDISIFDGHGYIFAQVFDQETFEILEVSGFQAVQHGNVNVKLGMMAGEGDMGITGDFFDIRNANDTNWVRLFHGGNQSNNFFNSSIYTGNNPRNPNHTNNYGLDISMFDIPNAGNNIISNNQTSTRFRYGTSRDTYIIFFMALAVDAYVPDIEPMHQVTLINGIPVGPDAVLTVEPGQEIEFSLEIRNRETEPINNFVVNIPLNFTTEYVSSSVEYFQGLSGGEPYLDTSNFGISTIVWEAGNLPLPSNPDHILARLTYTLRVSEDCFILANQNCEPQVTMQGTISGVGQISQIPFSNQPLIQGYVDGGDCEDEPISFPLIVQIDRQEFLDNNCMPLEEHQSRTINYCGQQQSSVPYGTVSQEFIPGTRFFSSIDENTGLPQSFATEFTPSNPFPATLGHSEYFAKPPGETDCWWGLNINVFNSTTTNTEPETYCFGQHVNLVHNTNDIISLHQITGLPEGITVEFIEGDVVLSGTPTESGQFNYSIILNTPCDNIPQITGSGTLIIQDPVLSGIIGPDQSWCPYLLPDTIASIADGSGSGDISFIWGFSQYGDDSGSIIIPDATSPNYFPGALSTTTWFWRTTVSELNGMVCKSEPTTPVVVYYHDPIVLNNIEIDHVHCKAAANSGAISFEIEDGPEPPFTFLWSNGNQAQSITGIETGYYTVSITDVNQCNVEEEFFVSFLDEDCVILIPQGFSPNNDGQNDTWALRNLAIEHPENVVKVFNRKGTLVFEAAPYLQNWNGVPNRGSVLVGTDGKVPSGVYFYMIWFNPEAKPISGYVFVSY